MKKNVLKSDQSEPNVLVSDRDSSAIKNDRGMFRPIVGRYGVGLTWCGLFCCLLSALLWVNSLPGAAAEVEPLKVIFDTDIDGDNDDVAAAATLHALAD